MTARRYPGLLGFRDLGGLRSRHGGRLRHGLLFRSGTPQFLELSPARALLADTGIRSTIDLRVPDEITVEGRGPLDQLRVRHLPLPFQIATFDERSSLMDDGDPLVQRYLSYLTEDASSVASLVPRLLEAGVIPALVHCTLGKDRTGVAIALILDALGVLREDIVSDYARAPEDVVAGRDRLYTMKTYSEAVHAYPPEAWTAPPEAMQRFLIHIDRQYGSSEKFLKTNGVTTGDVNRLRRIMMGADSW